MSAGPVSVLGFCKHKHHLGTKFVCPECGLPNANRFSCHEWCRGATWKAVAKPRALPGKIKPVFQTPASQPETEPPLRKPQLGDGRHLGVRDTLHLQPSELVTLLHVRVLDRQDTHMGKGGEFQKGTI